MGAMEGIFLDGLKGFVAGFGAGFVAGFVAAFVIGASVVFSVLKASKDKEILFESEQRSTRLESLQNFETECVKCYYLILSTESIELSRAVTKDEHKKAEGFQNSP